MVRRLGPAGWLLLLTAGLLIGACSRQEAAWRDARQDDTDAAYSAYLEDHPAGVHAGEARQRVGELREQQAWQRALRFDTPESYQQYLAVHPDGRYGDAARGRLAEFLRARAAVEPAAQAAAGPLPLPGAGAAVEPAQPVAGTLMAEAAGAGYRVQFGAFGEGEQAARDAWQALRDQHPDLLEPLAPRVDVVSREGRSLWRLQAGPLSEPRAREICAALAARGVDCIVVSG